jgi:hypothetical protein
MLRGGLFGGPIGLAASMANMAVGEATGKTVGGHLLAAAGSEQQQPDAPQPPVTVADARTLARGAASGNEKDQLLPPARPGVASFFQTPGVDTFAAARNNLFAISLPVPGSAAGPAELLAPAAAADDNSRLFDRRLRANKLSAKDLVEIMARCRQATPDEPVNWWGRLSRSICPRRNPPWHGIKSSFPI